MATSETGEDEDDAFYAAARLLSGAPQVSGQDGGAPDASVTGAVAPPTLPTFIPGVTAEAANATALVAGTVPPPSTTPPMPVAQRLAPFTQFLAAYPGSGWSAAVQLNLGLEYYRSGYFSKAIAAYQAAWSLGRNATDYRAKSVVDRAVGELARMYSRLGRATELEALLADVGARAVQGPATELMTNARESDWVMRNNPGVAFLCGPKALANVLLALGATPDAVSFLRAARSGPNGFTLAQVGALADQVGLAYRLIYRTAGQGAVPVPSVINWRLHHYAAIVAQASDGTYRVQDPTFASGDLYLLPDAIDAESSGFFLVPTSIPQDPAWRDATDAEASRRIFIDVFGEPVCSDCSFDGFKNSYHLSTVL